MRSLTFFCLFALFLASGILKGQEKYPADNVHFHLSGDKVVVTFDLLLPPGDDYTVRLSLQRSSSDTFRLVPSHVEGDVGKGITSGGGKKIIWDIMKEYPEGIEGSDFYFVVTAERNSGGLPTWVWLAGGGAAAALIPLLLHHPADNGGTLTQTQDTGFPLPGGRPQKP